MKYDKIISALNDLYKRYNTTMEACMVRNTAYFGGVTVMFQVKHPAKPTTLSVWTDCCKVDANVWKNEGEKKPLRQRLWTIEEVEQWCK